MIYILDGELVDKTNKKFLFDYFDEPSKNQKRYEEVGEVSAIFLSLRTVIVKRIKNNCNAYIAGYYTLCVHSSGKRLQNGEKTHSSLFINFVK